MRLKIRDIIDLAYLLDRDEQLSATETPQLFLERDRGIFKEIGDASPDRRKLLSAWLNARKRQEKEDCGNPIFFPGELFDRIYRMSLWVTGLAGILTGFLIVTALLVYHGTRPVNVSLFVFLFVLLPFVITLVAAGTAWVWKKPGLRESSALGLIHHLIFSVMLKTCGRMIDRLEYEPVRRGKDIFDSIRFFIKRKAAVLGDILFWPFFILTCVFSACFSLGTLGGTFFRVVLSDLAFGWQSTLSASSRTVHEIVSVVSWPWKYFVPDTMASPGIEQIEGSRIILKEGISVLSTQDLVSWWPFLCLAITCYAVLPRLVLILAGKLSLNYRLARFDFSHPQINDLIVRMTSPVVTYDVVEVPVSQVVRDPDSSEKQSPPIENEPVPALSNTLVLINGQIYSEEARARIQRELAKILLFNVADTIGVTHLFKTDEEILRAALQKDFGQVVLVQEAWQPPIKGLVFYVDQVFSILPEKTCLYIVLTGDAGDPDPFIHPDDPDIENWTRAVRQLNNPKIKIKGLFAS